MTRPLRIEYDGAWYHVMNRGLERRKIYTLKDDYQNFLALLKDLTEIHAIEVHAFSLMPNHYHLLIHTPTAGLSKAMKHLNGVYTQQFNKAHGRDGPLFRGRFKAIVVENDEYLQQLLRYIHQNPVKARLCKKAQDHTWTSHRYYLKTTKGFEWLTCDTLLHNYGKNQKTARQRLDADVKGQIPEAIVKEIETHRNAMIGSKGFKEWVNTNFIETHKKTDNEISKAAKNLNSDIKAKALLQNIAFCYNVDLKAIRQSQSATVNEPRSLAVYLLRQRKGYSLKQIAQWLHAPNQNAVGQTLYKFKQKMLRDSKFAKRVRELERAVVK